MKRRCRGEHKKAYCNMHLPIKIKNASSHEGQGRKDGGDKGNSSEQSTAFWTWVLSISTIVLAIVTTGVFIYAIKQSHDVEKSIGIARDTMIGDQRPWIGGPDGSYKGGRATFVFSNTGKTPATRVAINGDLVGKENWLNALGRICAEVDRNSPTDDLSRYVSITPNGKYVLHDLGRGNPFSGPDLVPRLRGHDFVVGCVIYGIPFDKNLHRTGFLIPIDKAEDGTISFGETTTLSPN